MRQLGLEFKTKHGGARKGAGRKRLPPALRHTPHRARPRHSPANPVHVTLRAYTRSLRRQQVARTVLGALRDTNSARFRVVHYSVQENHLHLVVEAEDNSALSTGVRGLMIRIARRVNQLLFHRGRFWADRWHGNALTAPRQVRNALVYVLENRHKHATSAARSATTAALDPLSSVQYFDGLADPIPIAFRSLGPPCVTAPSTWLLRIGWKRHGLIQSNEIPQSN